MSKPHIRRLTERDREIWVAMYRKIFPTDADAGLHAEITRILDDPERIGICAEVSNQAVGLAELSVRPFANGCHSHPVPFLEAIWVDAPYRQKGVARALLHYLEDYSRIRGYSEIGSDVLIDNQLGLNVHEHFGFEETERVVYFRKSI